MSRQTRRDRREMNDRQRRAAANETIGHQLAWWYYWETPRRVLLTVAVAVGAVWWVWENISHQWIAGTLAGVGVLLLVLYAAWIARNGLHARVMAVARGREINRSMWHLIGAAGTCLVAAAIVILKVAP